MKSAIEVSRHYSAWKKGSGDLQSARTSRTLFIQAPGFEENRQELEELADYFITLLTASASLHEARNALTALQHERITLDEKINQQHEKIDGLQAVYHFIREREP